MASRQSALEIVVMSKNQFNLTFWQNRKVLITGHTGFKGSWLSLWLSQLGANVSGISLDPKTEPNLFSQIKLHKLVNDHYLVDILDFDRLTQVVQKVQPEVVFHLAAQPLVRRSYLYPLETWKTNVIGSINVLESLKSLTHMVSVVMITTDKVYENKEWDYGYREIDGLGGHDPYSASKAAAEIAVASWRQSFCGNKDHQTPYLSIATARSGNVIGGGDWSEDRIVPDIMKCLTYSESVPVRNPNATRPWLHVLEPLLGYIRLAELLALNNSPQCGFNDYASAFNFGPSSSSNKSVEQLVEEIFTHWPGVWHLHGELSQPHEAGKLTLQIEKASSLLGWYPSWSFQTTIERTVSWYKQFNQGISPLDLCLSDINSYANSLH